MSTCEGEYNLTPLYSGSSDCLRTEQRSRPPNRTSDSNATNAISSGCNCVMRMLRHGRTLSLCGTGVLFFSLRLLIGLQTWFALKVDHEEVRSCCTSKGAPHAVPLRIEDCKSGGGSAGHGRKPIRGLALSIVLSSLLVVCLMIELDDLAVATKGPSCGNQMPGKEDRLRTSNYMYSWVLLHMVMLSIAMFAGIMPIVVELSSGSGDGAAATGGDRENRDDGKIGYKVHVLITTFHELFSFSRGRYYIY